MPVLSEQAGYFLIRSAGTMELSVSTGSIRSSRPVSCQGDVSLRFSTGRVELTDVTCGNFTAKGSTGDMKLTKVMAKGRMELECSTGDIRLDRCDAAEISARTSTGDITGTIRSEKVFSAKTSTGKVSVPQGSSGGKCELKTTTGDIQIAYALD